MDGSWTWQKDPVFSAAIARVFRNEGDGTISDNSSDPGGLTRWGICARDYPHQDIRNLSSDAAAQLIYNTYWVAPNILKLREPISAKMLDLAVLFGCREAVVILQRAVRANGPTLKEDGILGGLTLAAVSTANVGGMMGSLRSEAAGVCRLINARKVAAGEDDPFLAGWLRRVYQ